MINITQIAAAALNSMWQAAIVTAAVWLALKYVRGIEAATRYVIWWMVLAAILALPFAPRITAPSRKTAHPATAVTARPPAMRYLKTPAPPEPETIITLREERSSTWPLWIVAAWSALCLYRLTQTAIGYFYLRRIKQRARISPRPLPVAPRAVRLLLSDEIPSPLAAGFLRPAILIPASLPDELSHAELDHALLHEAAHIARRDDWMNLIGRLLGAALVFHPVALWIVARIEREREMACDDWVVARTGAAHSYAESLTRVCELSRRPLRATLASGALGGRSRIRERIEMLLIKGRDFKSQASSARVAASAVALLALMAAVSPVAPWITLAQRPEFEVSSVKKNTTDGNYDAWPRRSGDLVIMHNTRLYSMIFYAYHLEARFQLVGNLQAQEWRDWYDVDATAPGSPSNDQIRLMLQSLLEDRFKLKVHRETREMAAYRLLVAKNGLKLKPADGPLKTEVDGRPFTGPAGRCANLAGRDGFHLVCAGATIAQMLPDLIGSLMGPVVDETGLTGTYNYLLTYQRPDGRTPDDVESAPPLSEAIQADLGLKLEKGKAPVEVLVIDHVEKPSGN